MLKIMYKDCNANWVELKDMGVNEWLSQFASTGYEYQFLYINGDHCTYKNILWIDGFMILLQSIEGYSL